MKSPHKFGSKEWKKDLLKETGDHLNSVTNKNTKFVLLNDEKKETNYNKKMNTMYVNKKHVGRYDLMKDLLIK